MIKSNEFMKAYISIINESAESIDVENTKVPKTAEASDNNVLKQICFQTSDTALIDTLNGDFEEVVFFVKTTNDTGEDTISEVKFKPESFNSIVITDVKEKLEDDEEQINEDEDEDEPCENCGKSPCECNEDEENSDDITQVDECDDGSDGEEDIN